MSDTNSLYYIMDNRSNFYRLDNTNQLVMAKCQEEATIFTYNQASRRISGGKKCKFYSMISLEDLSDIEKAFGRSDTEIQKEQSNSKSKKDKNNSVIKLKDLSSVFAKSVAGELTFEELEKPVEKSIITYDLSKMDWVEYLSHFLSISESIDAYRESGIQKLSEAEQKVSDVLHYIELCETNVMEAADLVELLRVCRENRREAKDEIYVLEAFQRNIATPQNVAKVKETLKQINGLKNRKYTPRKYAELFENSQKIDRYHKYIDNDAVNEKSVIEKTNVENSEIKREKVMVRNETPFDNKDNNWLAIAKQQLEFYKYAKQYQINLELDIEDIDSQIEELLADMEGQNCNVAQGYKYFKKLKDLRLERKEKHKELQCLSAMTSGLNCADMESFCNESLSKLEDILQVKNIENIENIKKSSKEEQPENNIAPDTIDEIKVVN